MDEDIRQVCAFLQQIKTRVTYGAIAGYFHIPAQSVGEKLGVPCKLGSWVVNAQTGNPTGYNETQYAEGLFSKDEIIEHGDDIKLKMRLSDRNRNN